MPSAPRLTRTRWAAVYRLFAMLAVAAQCVLVLSAIGEGRAGVGQAAHVESSQNTTTHYAHDEATCAACQARTLMTVPLPTPVRLAERIAVRAQLTGAPNTELVAPALPANPTRAPPAVI